MAKIPTPQRGQPLDLTYMYTLAEAVNDTIAEVSTASYQYSTINSKDVKTSQMKVVAGNYNVVTSEKVQAGTTKSFDFPFNTTFKYTPVATATPIILSGTTAGNDVTVTLTSVSTSSLSGVVRFLKDGDVAGVSVNLLVVGIPN